EDVTNRVRESLEAFAGTSYFRVDRTIEDQMSFVKRVFRSGQPNPIQSIPLGEFGKTACSCCYRDGLRRTCRYVFCAHFLTSCFQEIYPRCVNGRLTAMRFRTLRTDVVVIVPEPDYWPGKVMLIADRTETRRA